MGVLAEQPQKEQLRSFDPLASVRMLRYDYDTFGKVLPETRARVQDEELSYLVEGMDRAARTEFVLRRNGNDLSYFNKGKWSSYTGMLEAGLLVASAEAQTDPRRQFLAEDATNDLFHNNQMRRLQPGQQYVWHSPYRYDVEQRYGADFMKDCGRFPHRKMGFIYRAHCNEDGDVVLESQTVDRSNDKAFAAVLDVAHADPAIDMNSLVRTYDVVVSSKLGEKVYAGRLGSERDENAWAELYKHQDLIEYFLVRLENFAQLNLPSADLVRLVKRHTYGTWAAFKKRLDGEVFSEHVGRVGSGVVSQLVLEREVHSRFEQFAREGSMLIGCGGRIMMLQNEKDVLEAEADDVFSAIFSKKSDSENCEFMSKECPLCHAKDVWTKSTKTHVRGSCGCVKKK
jgi:hypothetical protein